MIREPRRRRFLAYALLTGLVPLVTAGSVAAAEPAEHKTTDSGPHGATVTLISRGTMAKPFEVESADIEVEAERIIDVAVIRVTFEPGGSTGWHVHHGPVLVTVTAGEVTHIKRNCKRHTYTVGQSFTENGPRDLTIVRNLGGVTATVVGTFLVPTGANPLTPPAPAPRCAKSR